METFLLNLRDELVQAEPFFNADTLVINEKLIRYFERVTAIALQPATQLAWPAHDPIALRFAELLMDFHREEPLPFSHEEIQALRRQIRKSQREGATPAGVPAKRE